MTENDEGTPLQSAKKLAQALEYANTGHVTVFGDLKGETLNAVTGSIGDDEIVFETVSGKKFKLYHSQDCCESVSVESIAGDIADLIGQRITLAEEASSRTNPAGVQPQDYEDSFTWTFYKLATIKGYVDIRWYGSSNGYYGESVDFSEIKP